MTEKRTRIDRVLTERGLTPSREKASVLILAGAVEVDGVRVDKPSALVSESAAVLVRAPDAVPVSRGAHKLSAALDEFKLDPANKVAVDVGASTGGFTEILLKRGVNRVYAVDVGYGQLAWRIRNDPRVVVMERTNFRHVRTLPERPEVAVVDVSFISLELILPVLAGIVAPTCDAVVLVKPQFEAGKELVKKGGVVRDPIVHAAVLRKVIEAAGNSNWMFQDLIASPIVGPAGNREFLVHLELGSSDALDPTGLIAAVTSDRRNR